MDVALEEIEFLALSANRVEVLRLLATEPHSRGELAAETGASQATLGRIIADFEERSWIRRTGGEYVATATGRIVANGFTDLLGGLETSGGCATSSSISRAMRWPSTCNIWPTPR